MPVIFSYTPTVTGAQVNSAVQAATAALPPASAGPVVWGTALQQIYADFDSMLGLSMDSAILGGMINFPPFIPPSMPLPWAPVALTFSALAQASGTAIDGAIKAQTSSMQGSAQAGAGMIVWSEFLKQVYNDICTVIPPLIATGMNSLLGKLVVQMFPPFMVGAPSSPLLMMPWMPTMLQGLLMSVLNPGTALGMGAALDATIKAKTSAKTGTAHNTTGIDVWQSAIDQLKTDLMLSIGTNLPIFVMTGGKYWVQPAMAFQPPPPAMAGAPNPPGTGVIA